MDKSMSGLGKLTLKLKLFIGGQHERWMSVMTRHCLSTNEETAKLLLDFYEDNWNVVQTSKYSSNTVLLDKCQIEETLNSVDMCASDEDEPDGTLSLSDDSCLQSVHVEKNYEDNCNDNYIHKKSSQNVLRDTTYKDEDVSGNIISTTAANLTGNTGVGSLPIKIEDSTVEPIHGYCKQEMETEEPYKNSECDNESSDGSLLAQRIPPDTGGKQYTCSVCKASFTSLQCKMKHMRSHTGAKSFKCKKLQLG